MSDDLTRCPCCDGEGYFYGDETPPSPWGDAAEIARLRAEVEQLTAKLQLRDGECAAKAQIIAQLEATLSDERAHADALAETLYGIDGLQEIDCEMRDTAVQRHRARRHQ